MNTEFTTGKMKTSRNY